MVSWPLRSPTVPKATPAGQVLSAQSCVISSTRSGRASVVRSRSAERRRRKTSRTDPPTMAS